MIEADLAQLGADRLLATLIPNEGSGTLLSHPQILGEVESTRLVSLCNNNRLSPLLADAVHTGRIVIADAALHELSTAVEHFLATQLRVEVQGVAAIDALTHTGVDFRVTKGLATGYLDYPNPAMRPIGDLDILIRPRDMGRAIDALASLEGGDFLTPPGNDWRVTHAIPFVLRAVEIDVHNRLLHQAAGHRAARFDLFADPDPYEVAGRQVLALPPWLRLVQAASQNILGDTQQVSSDLDVARLAQHLDTALANAKEVGLGWVVAEGTRKSQQNLGWGTPLSSTAPETLPDRGFRRIYDGDEATVLERTIFEIASAKPSVGAAIIRSALRPGDAYLERRGRSASGQISRQINRLRRIGR